MIAFLFVTELESGRIVNTLGAIQLNLSQIIFAFHPFIFYFLLVLVFSLNFFELMVEIENTINFNNGMISSHLPLAILTCPSSV